MAKKKKYNPTKILGIAAIVAGAWFIIKKPKVSPPVSGLNNIYDVVYRTKSGRVMVAKAIEAKDAKSAKKKLKKQMQASSSFDKVISAFIH